MSLPASSPGESTTSVRILQAEGPTLPKLFENIAHQLFQKIIDPQDVGLVLREKVVVEGANLQRLLQEWVISLLNLVRLQKMIFAETQVLSLKTPEEGPCSLLAETVGELVDFQRHEIKLNLDTVVCREIRLNQDSKGYSAEIILGE